MQSDTSEPSTARDSLSVLMVGVAGKETATFRPRENSAGIEPSTARQGSSEWNRERTQGPAAYLQSQQARCALWIYREPKQQSPKVKVLSASDLIGRAVVYRATSRWLILGTPYAPVHKRHTKREPLKPHSLN